MPGGMLNILIDRIASLLHTHIDIVRNLENLALAARAGGGVESLRREVERLREVRERLIEDLKTAYSMNPQGEEFTDLRALAGYYLEAGSKRERAALLKVNPVINVEEDLSMLDNARSIAMMIINRKQSGEEQGVV